MELSCSFKASFATHIFIVSDEGSDALTYFSGKHDWLQFPYAHTISIGCQSLSVNMIMLQSLTTLCVVERFCVYHT